MPDSALRRPQHTTLIAVADSGALHWDTRLLRTRATCHQFEGNAWAQPRSTQSSRVPPENA